MELLAQYRVVNLKVQVKDVHHTFSQWTHVPNFTSLHLFRNLEGSGVLWKLPSQVVNRLGPSFPSPSPGFHSFFSADGKRQEACSHTVPGPPRVA